jgi:hypothetical protein
VSGQLDFGSATPKGTRTFHLDVHDGLGWMEVVDADHPRDLLDEARRQRADHPSRRIVIRSRDPSHDEFVAGWAPREAVKELPDWIVGAARRDNARGLEA